MQGPVSTVRLAAPNAWRQLPPRPAAVFAGLTPGSVDFDGFDVEYAHDRFEGSLGLRPSARPPLPWDMPALPSRRRRPTVFRKLWRTAACDLNRFCVIVVVFFHSISTGPVLATHRSDLAVPVSLSLIGSGSARVAQLQAEYCRSGDGARAHHSTWPWPSSRSDDGACPCN